MWVAVNNLFGKDVLIDKDAFKCTLINHSN